MNIIENYEKACKDIAEHVGYEECIQEYCIDTNDKNYFWQSCSEDETIYWAETKEDILEDTGDVYSSETSGIYRGENITLVLIRSDFDSSKYWLVLNSKNEIK